MTLRTFAEIDLDHPPELAFAVIIRPRTIPMAFQGAGPIPGTVHAEVLGDGVMRPGARRVVRASDGTSVHEVIEELVAPSRQRYTLSGFSRPFSWLVRAGEGCWTLSPVGAGTHVRWDFSFLLTTVLAWPVVVLLLHVWFRRAMVQALGRIREAVGREAVGVG